MEFSKILKNFFSNLAQYLLIKLPKPDKYILESIIQYYCSFAITADFCLVSSTEKQIFKIMQDIKSSKTAGVDKLSEKFLKDWVDILAKALSALCYLSYPEESFQMLAKLQN